MSEVEFCEECSHRIGVDNQCIRCGHVNKTFSGLEVACLKEQLARREKQVTQMSLELSAKDEALNAAEAQLAEQVNAVGKYDYINGSELVRDSYSALRIVRAAKAKGKS